MSAPRAPLALALVGALLSTRAALADDAAASPAAPPREVLTPRPFEVIPTRLTYSAPKSCYDEQDFRILVSKSTGGSDPFSATGAQGVDVKVTRAGGNYVAEVVTIDADGTRHSFPNKIPDPSCVLVLETVRTIIEGRLKHYVAAPAPKPVEVPPPPAAAPSRAEIPPEDLPHDPPPPAPAPAPKTAIVWRLGASVWGDYATVPGIVPALAASAGVRYAWVSAALEGRWDAPAGLSVPGGFKVNLAQVSGGLLLCGHFGWFVPCALGQASEMQFSGSASAPSHALARGVFGGRVAADFRLPHHVSIQPAVDMLGAFGVKEAPPPSGAIKLPLFNAGLGAGIFVELDSP